MCLKSYRNNGVAHRPVTQAGWGLQVSSALDKISTRERFLNSQCDHLTAEYREAKERLSRLQMQFSQKQDAAAEMDSELSQVVAVGRISPSQRDQGNMT